VGDALAVVALRQTCASVAGKLCYRSHSHYTGKGVGRHPVLWGCWECFLRQYPVPQHIFDFDHSDHPDYADWTDWLAIAFLPLDDLTRPAEFWELQDAHHDDRESVVSGAFAAFAGFVDAVGRWDVAFVEIVGVFAVGRDPPAVHHLLAVFDTCANPFHFTLIYVYELSSILL
jgi:hypothetical protein